MLILLLINSCTTRVFGGRSISPVRHFALNINPPPGPPHYQLGWSHGCESAQASVNTTPNVMAQTHQYYINGQLWNNIPDYKKGWKEGYDHCVFNMFSFLLNTL